MSRFALKMKQVLRKKLSTCVRKLCSCEVGMKQVFLSVDPLVEQTKDSYGYCYQNPIQLVDKNGAIPTPAEAARMAAHVYGDKHDDILTGGWKVSNTTFGLSKNDLVNSATGLKSQIYERTVKGKTEYTYATAGTEANWKDIKANLGQPTSFSDQYEKSASNATTISDKLKRTGEELTFTGHSLGGGEAALNALVTDRSAITFNAAGVGYLMKDINYGRDVAGKSESKINAYIMATDPLNLLQDASPIMPNVNGNRNYLVPTDFSSAINGHSMDNVLKNFGVNPSSLPVKNGQLKPFKPVNPSANTNTQNCY